MNSRIAALFHQSYSGKLLSQPTKIERMQTLNDLNHDLHCHSNQSDGILSPEELVSRAKSKGVEVLALTDHDSTAGIARAQAQAKLEGMTVIAGIEFSSDWCGRGVHVVGLNVDLDAAALKEAEQQQENRRNQRATTIAERLEKVGVKNSLEGAQAYADSGVLGRPHFARFLVEQGYVSNVNQAFKRYLGAGKPGDVKNMWPDVGEVVGWIRDSGGVPVLAHPMKYTMTRSKLCKLIEDFTEAGGQAMEVISGAQAANVTGDLANIVCKYSLAASCGSDFHVPDQPWQELGRFGRLPEKVQPVWELF